MAHHDHVANDTKKEIIQALVGVVLFLAMVAFIGISAFLRPAGDHVNVEALNAQASAVSETAPATATTNATETASTVASAPSVASAVENAVNQGASITASTAIAVSQNQ